VDAGRESTRNQDPESGRSSQEFRSDLENCLSVLSPREREVFVLRDLENFDIKETAGALGISSISVRVNLSSARRKVRDVILAKYPHLQEGS
jgi:RNA polymerase sigma-70 factor (ECF subfamily)